MPGFTPEEILAYAQQTAVDMVSMSDEVRRSGPYSTDELEEMVLADSADLWREYVNETASSEEPGEIPLDVEACLTHCLTLAKALRPTLLSTRRVKTLTGTL